MNNTKAYAAQSATFSKAQRAEFRAINPSTGELVKPYQGHSQQEVDAILQTVSSTYRPWRSASPLRQAQGPLYLNPLPVSFLAAPALSRPFSAALCFRLEQYATAFFIVRKMANSKKTKKTPRLTVPRSRNDWLPMVRKRSIALNILG
jgi:hypothetical protein